MFEINPEQRIREIYRRSYPRNKSEETTDWKSIGWNHRKYVSSTLESMLKCYKLDIITSLALTRYSDSTDIHTVKIENI